MNDIRYKINVVAAIAAVGAAIAFIGCIMSWNQFPNSVGFIDMVVFFMITFLAILNIKPNVKVGTAIWNTALGILGIVVAALKYVRIADEIPEASSFMDVGLGIWITFAGIIIYTIFCFSDTMFKLKR